MTFHHKSRRAIPWLVLAAVVTALAVPVAAAAKPTPGTSGASQQVQIGGQLVQPSVVSAWQARAHQAPLPSQLVQIGGRLVQPSQVSSVQSGLGSSAATVSTSSDGGVNWSAVSGGLAGFVLLIGVSGYALRTRRRVATTA